MEDFTIKTRKEAARVPGPIISSPPVLLATVDELPQITERQIRPSIQLKGCDATPQISVHEVNTDKNPLSHNSMGHLEGGWPKEVNATEHQETSKWRKRMERDPGFISCLKKLTTSATELISKNNGLDMYEMYFDSETVQFSADTTSLKIHTVCKDICETATRKITSINWHPDGASKFAASYSVYSTPISLDPMSTMSFVWDQNMPNSPLIELKGSGPIMALKYNLKSTDLLVGGTLGGFVELWDLRRGSDPVETSNPHNSHSAAINAISWIQSKTHNEFVTISSDGYVFWWDNRNIDSPIDKYELLSLPSDNNEAINLGGRSVECSFEAGHVKFLFGTEQGSIIAATKGIKKGIETNQRYNADGLTGPVHSINRNPSHPQYFFTITDWSMKLWAEDVKAPISSSQYQNSSLICGQWSPTRPGLCMIGKSDGILDFWDFIEKQNEPSVSHKISSFPLSALSVHRKGKHVAIGDGDGTISILELNEGLYVENYAEKIIVEKNFERNSRKEKKLEIARKQAQREKGPFESEPITLNSKITEIPPKNLSLLEKEFFEAVNLEDNKANDHNL